jgi:transcriptional regulator with XRE-family HTH domain
MAKENFKQISDKRMLQVMKFWQEKNGKTQSEFCEKIGLHRGNISPIRKGFQSFQINHIIAAMKLIGNGNFNFVFGVEENMFLPNRKITSTEALDLAVKSVKDEIAQLKRARVKTKK